MTSLERIQAWYAAQCNGDWEHDEGVSIATIDNPGWSVKVNLRETDLEGRQFSRIELERNEQDWIHAWRTGSEFHIACGPLNLEEALALFCDWADG